MKVVKIIIFLPHLHNIMWTDLSLYKTGRKIKNTLARKTIRIHRLLSLSISKEKRFIIFIEL